MQGHLLWLDCLLFFDQEESHHFFRQVNKLLHWHSLITAILGSTPPFLRYIFILFAALEKEIQELRHSFEEENKILRDKLQKSEALVKSLQAAESKYFLSDPIAFPSVYIGTLANWQQYSKWDIIKKFWDCLCNVKRFGICACQQSFKKIWQIGWDRKSWLEPKANLYINSLTHGSRG